MATTICGSVVVGVWSVCASIRLMAGYKQSTGTGTTT